MKRALILGVALCALVGFAEPATKPSELKFGGVRVRADAPAAVIGYFEIITVREKAVVDAIAEIEGWIKDAPREMKGKPAAERSRHMRGLRAGIEAGKKMLTEIREPNYRPAVGDGNDITRSESVLLVGEIIVKSLPSETVALIRPLSGKSEHPELARRLIGVEGWTEQQRHYVGDNPYPSAAALEAAAKRDAQRVAFEDAKMFAGVTDDQTLKIDRPTFRDGVYRDYGETVPRFRLMTEDPEAWVVK